MTYIPEFQDLLTQLRIDESAESDGLYDVLGRLPSLPSDWSSVTEELRNEATSSDEIAGVEAFVTNESLEPDAKLDLLTDSREALAEVADPEAAADVSEPDEETTTTEPVDEWAAFYTAQKAADPGLTDAQISALFTGGQAETTPVSDPGESPTATASADDWSTFYFAQKAADPNLTDDQIADAWTQKQPSDTSAADQAKPAETVSPTTTSGDPTTSAPNTAPSADKPAAVPLQPLPMDQFPLLVELAGHQQSDDGAKAFISARGFDLSVLERTAKAASQLDQVLAEAESKFRDLEMMTAQIEKLATQK